MVNSSQNTEIPVQIELHSKINRFNDWETYDLYEPGQLTYTQNAIYLRYTETNENPELPATKVMLKIADDGTIKMRRNGLLNTQMHFNPQQLTHTNYHTPAGNIILDVKTNTLNHQSSNHGTGHIEITYQLVENQQPLGNYQMTVDYQAET